VTDDVLFFFVTFGGIALFVISIVIYDLLAERQHRREQEQRKSA
jgi:hypothetical protein